MNAHTNNREVFKPASKFIPGTSLLTNVERWEIVGKRVYVTYTDGTVFHSEETPSSLRNGTFAVPA
jgi:hypothetical protein